MMRRLAAVGILTLASLFFASRFRPPPQMVSDEDPAFAAIAIAPPPPKYTTLTLPSSTTTTLPPGVEKYESNWIRFERGVLQLEVTLTYGEITDIEMVRTPSSSERAKQTNLDAHPLLREEAIAIQDYRVHVVSGATETTRVWARALKDALEQAGFCLLTPRELCDMPLE